MEFTRRARGGLQLLTQPRAPGRVGAAQLHHPRQKAQRPDSSTKRAQFTGTGIHTHTPVSRGTPLIARASTRSAWRLMPAHACAAGDGRATMSFRPSARSGWPPGGGSGCESTRTACASVLQASVPPRAFRGGVQRSWSAGRYAPPLSSPRADGLRPRGARAWWACTLAHKSTNIRPLPHVCSRRAASRKHKRHRAVCGEWGLAMPQRACRVHRPSFTPGVALICSHGVGQRYE